MNRFTRQQMAARVARDIPEGACVNLGIGLPTTIANFLPPGREILLQSENGVLGMGPAPAPGMEDPDLINASKQPVTVLSGGSYFHHADSFGMMRGGHLDICVLGAFQVSVAGDLANWHTGEADAIPAVGGAMDLAIGAKNVFVMMEHLTKSGQSKIVAQCSYPITALACVDRIYTDLAVIDVTPTGLVVIDMVDGLGPHVGADHTHIAAESEFGRRRGHAARWPAPHRLQPHDAGAHAAECRCVARRQDLERCARTGERSGRILVPGSNPDRRRTCAHHVHMEAPAHQTCRDRSDDASVACYEPESPTRQ